MQKRVSVDITRVCVYVGMYIDVRVVCGYEN